jgi:hypothetical protein
MALRCRKRAPSTTSGASFCAQDRTDASRASGNSPRRVAPQFESSAGSPTTTNGAQYLGSARSGCCPIIASHWHSSLGTP